MLVTLPVIVLIDLNTVWWTHFFNQNVAQFMQKTAIGPGYFMSVPVLAALQKQPLKCRSGGAGAFTLILMRMKLTAFLMAVTLMNVYAAGTAQTITFTSKEVTLKKAFAVIEEKTGYVVFGRTDLLAATKPVSVQAKDMPLTDFLQLILKNQQIDFKIVNKTILLSQQKNIPDAVPTNRGETAEDNQWYATITGVVTDSTGIPLTGATITVKGTKYSVTTDKGGRFSVNVSPGDVLTISYIGYESREVTISNNQALNIRLNLSKSVMNETVVTGMVNRDKASFTGAASTFTGEQLKSLGNRNIIQSLRTLDPSILQLENNQAGSNPNVLPTLELRGQTSISTESLQDEFSDNPNQPLFILDGFETTLRTIVDLDMNRVASISILKDAASTVIYGSRASNGVIVVETIRPKAGAIMLNYTSDLTMELPDLNGYNMMNAAEKLEFERLSGVYTVPSTSYMSEYQNSYYNPLYAERLKLVKSGVNSYWLNEPLQTGFSQKHSLYAEGGSESLTFNAGGNYRKLSGAMKGSGREDWGARVNLTYRNGKLNINNNLLVSGYTADVSNYGSFATWVNTNPYYKKESVSNPYLFSYYNWNTLSNIQVANPLYNANLNSFDKTKNYGITNNLQLNYDINRQWRIQSSLQVIKGNTEQTIFKSPQHSDFFNAETLKKGTYTYRQTGNLSYSANLMVSYVQSFGKHTIQTNVRTEIQDKTYRLKGFLAEGFPASSNGNPRFAYGYDEDGVPSSVSSITRRNSLIANAYYTYDKRYNADLSFTYDGSTAFGQKNMYQPFFSAGVSWNLHKEAFLAQARWINNLRLRASYGVTGNQNFTSTTSISTYSYLTSYNYSGQGVELTTMGNPDLAWQNTYQTNLGLDATLFNNRFSAQINVYKKYTDPLVVATDLPSSTSLTNYPINAGNLTVLGIEANLRYAVIYKPQQRVSWYVGITATTQQQKYGGFNNILSGLNKSLRDANSLTRYLDGYDAYDLWAVPSLGIDPATGKELFLKKDGTQTFIYDYNDQVKVGNSRPKVQGVLSTNFSYKGFTAGIYMRYIIQQDIWNTALFSKVENISLSKVVNNNQDRRALYDRWKQPGDIAQFRSISLTSTTQMSSRFVQRENAISFESISLGYEFRNAPWLNRSRFSNLRVTAYANEAFKVSNIRRERGTDYPYANSLSVSVTTNFK